MSLQIVYSPKYDINVGPLEDLHPFDSRKYGRAMAKIRSELGPGIEALVTAPTQQADLDTLTLVHSEKYLKDLKRSQVVAKILEIPLAGYLPNFLVDRLVLQPMRWATQGTVLAADLALKNELCVNMSGGYHHAKPDSGEGFCVYSDITLAIEYLRNQGSLKSEDLVAYIDLDAHQGNGVAHCTLHDPRVKLFDMYNADIYPAFDDTATDRIDCKVELATGTNTQTYLRKLKDSLPYFLENFQEGGKFKLAIYNAGTDIYEKDPLGRLGVSKKAVLERDLFVINELKNRNIPTLMLPSGGYTKESHALIAETVRALYLQNNVGTSEHSI